MSNIAGKAYAMNVLTPIRRRWSWLPQWRWLPTRPGLQVLFFMLSRCRPSQLGRLLGLRLIHFARWVVIPRDAWPDLGQGRPHLQHDAMLFLSNFNGTWDQYIDAFADGLPDGLDLFWYTSSKYPRSIPVGEFKAYIARNQIDTNYYYNATPGAAQRDIKRALRLAQGLAALTAVHAKGDPAAFAAEYRRQLVEEGLQNCLGSHGYAPSASVAAESADRDRAAYLDQSQAADWRVPAPADAP
ncbi:hypothetical protein [Roseicella frigidaeris]|uniref:Uncharacterized protein n=1 Tax=Roseicella frigidaeris TaxID=2230885 RepID=A0A327MAJ9_9PROT|nr:hypothetical protein [Roseicella frigidaeris]RAI59475.1 hypothetical protein DOO78_07680 [Roseicella frigidaeris]